MVCRIDFSLDFDLSCGCICTRVHQDRLFEFCAFYDKCGRRGHGYIGKNHGSRDRRRPLKIGQSTVTLRLRKGWLRRLGTRCAAIRETQHTTVAQHHLHHRANARCRRGCIAIPLSPATETEKPASPPGAIDSLMAPTQFMSCAPHCWRRRLEDQPLSRPRRFPEIRHERRLQPR
jgi:hypothetical protein